MNLRQTISRFTRFSSVGVFTTLLGLFLNTVLLKWFKTPLFITYISVYITNTFVSYILNSKITFNVPLSVVKLGRYYAIYLTSLLLGILLLKIFKQHFGFENWVYPFMVVPFTMTTNFVLASVFIGKRA